MIHLVRLNLEEDLNNAPKIIEGNNSNSTRSRIPSRARLTNVDIRASREVPQTRYPLSRSSLAR